MKYTIKIKKSKTFKYIFRKGNYYSGKYIVIHICKAKYNSDNNFFGVCVSKKNGNSVKRNKLKRWVREVYKVEEEKLLRGYNIVFLYKKYVTIENLNYNLIKNDICYSLNKLNLYE